MRLVDSLDGQHLGMRPSGNDDPVGLIFLTVSHHRIRILECRMRSHERDVFTLQYRFHPRTQLFNHRILSCHDCGEVEQVKPLILQDVDNLRLMTECFGRNTSAVQTRAASLLIFEDGGMYTHPCGIRSRSVATWSATDDDQFLHACSSFFI